MFDPSPETKQGAMPAPAGSKFRSDPPALPLHPHGTTPAAQIPPRCPNLGVKSLSRKTWIVEDIKWFYDVIWFHTSNVEYCFYIKSFYTSNVINVDSILPCQGQVRLPENDAEPLAATCQGLRNELHRGKHLSAHQ